MFAAVTQSAVSFEVVIAPSATFVPVTAFAAICVVPTELSGGISDCVVPTTPSVNETG